MPCHLFGQCWSFIASRVVYRARHYGISYLGTILGFHGESYSLFTDRAGGFVMSHLWTTHAFPIPIQSASLSSRLKTALMVASLKLKLQLTLWKGFFPEWLVCMFYFFNFLFLYAANLLFLYLCACVCGACACVCVCDACVILIGFVWVQTAHYCGIHENSSVLHLTRCSELI